MDPDGGLAAIARRVPTGPGRTGVLAVAGPVAVGKTSVAGTLADLLRGDGRSVEVVSTDGFLLPNAVLEGQGLAARKGFPETYDLDRLDRLLSEARSGRSPLAVPVYSHEHYDVLAEPASVARPDVLVLEGVVALQRRFGDVGVYVHADEDHVAGWYVARFVELVEAARNDPTSFYRPWVDLDRAAVEELAHAVWTGVNRPNLVEHIAPTRVRADVVVHKAEDHRIVSVEWVEP